MMDLQCLTAYVCGKIDGAPVVPDPFPHCVIRDFWPQDVYAELLATLPEENDWKRRGDYGLGGLTRMASRFQPSAVWAGCYAVLESDPMMASLCRKWNLTPGVNRCLLHRDTAGYGISPHTDIETKRLAYILYCASGQETADQMRELGTYFLVPRLPYFRLKSYGDHHMPWFGFHVECTIPYTPNTLVFWPRTPESYHAVHTPFAPDDPVQARYSVRGFVFAPDTHLPYIFQEDTKERGIV